MKFLTFLIFATLAIPFSFKSFKNNYFYNIIMTIYFHINLPIVVKCRFFNIKTFLIFAVCRLVGLTGHLIKLLIKNRPSQTLSNIYKKGAAFLADLECMQEEENPRWFAISTSSTNFASPRSTFFTSDSELTRDSKCQVVRLIECRLHLLIPGRRRIVA